MPESPTSAFKTTWRLSPELSWSPGGSMNHAQCGARAAMWVAWEAHRVGRMDGKTRVKNWATSSVGQASTSAAWPKNRRPGVVSLRMILHLILATCKKVELGLCDNLGRAGVRLLVCCR